MQRDGDRNDERIRTDAIVRWARALARRVRERNRIPSLERARAIEQWLGREPPAPAPPRPSPPTDVCPPAANVFPLVMRRRR